MCYSSSGQRKSTTMIALSKLLNKPNKLKRFTSLNPDQFKTLVCQLRPLWEKSEFDRLSRDGRKRAIGAGRPYKLATLEEMVAMVLLWYRTNTTHELIGWIVGIDGTNVGRLIKRISPLIEPAADPALATLLKEAKQARGKIKTWDEFVTAYPDLAEVIVDATEQRRKRPAKRRKQKRVYSGKKHAHTLKTQITVSKTGRLLDVSKTYPGRIHDKKVLDLEKTLTKLPKRTKKRMDKGYDGVIKDHPGLNIVLPHKRRRNSPPLTRGQKQANTLRSKARILVENTIARLKKYRVLDDKYRGSEEDYNQHFRNIAALCNYRLATVK